jgi:hypothetical protein
MDESDELLLELPLHSQRRHNIEPQTSIIPKHVWRLAE